MADEQVGEPAAPAKKRGCGFWVMIAIAVVIGIAVLGAIFGPSPEEQAAVDTKAAADAESSAVRFGR